MNKEKVVTHFAHLRALCEEHNVDSESSINLDESGFSPGGMTLGRSKCFGITRSSGSTKMPKFRGTRDHATTMPVIFAIGKVYNMLLVLPETEAKYCKWSDAELQIQKNYYLNHINYL